MTLQDVGRHGSGQGSALVALQAVVNALMRVLLQQFFDRCKQTNSVSAS